MIETTANVEHAGRRGWLLAGAMVDGVAVKERRREDRGRRPSKPTPPAEQSPVEELLKRKMGRREGIG